MTLSEVLSLGALLISALTALGLFKIARGQGLLSDRQRDLEDDWREYRHEVVEMRRNHAASARIELVCYDTDRLTITNAGGAEARNVNVVCDCPDGGSVFPANLGLFPIDRLGPGRSATAILALTMGCYFPLPASVTWENPDGTFSEEPVTLRLE